MLGDNMSTKPVIFLDIDGVLNNERWAKKMFSLTRETAAWELDPANIDALNRLIDKVDADIVVSSCWRVREDLADVLVVWGLPRPIGRTPRLPGASRGEEIAAWLLGHPDVEQFVIIDDDDDMLPEQKSRFVKVSGDVGFGWEQVNQALEIFGCPDAPECLSQKIGGVCPLKDQLH
jgi:hypothetical protein